MKSYKDWLDTQIADQAEQRGLSTRELRMLLLMGQTITQGQNEEDICYWVSEAVSSLLEAPVVSLALKDTMQNGSWIVHGKMADSPLPRSLVGELADLAEMERPAPQKPGGVAALQKSDLPSDLIRRGINYLVQVPVRTIHQEFGSLMIGKEAPWELNSREKFILTTLTNQATVALENVRLRRESSEHAERLASFNRMIKAITSSLDLQGVFRLLSSEAQHFIPHDRASVALAAPNEETVTVYAATGREAQLGAGTVFPMAGSLVGQVIESGEGWYTRDLSEQQDYLETPSILALGIRSSVVAPLWDGDDCFGCLNFGSTQIDKYGPDDLALAQEIADQIAVAIVNVRLHDQAQKLAVLEERQRVARELHDSAAQALYGIVMYAEAARQLLDDGDLAAGYFGEIRDTAQEAQRDMRLLIFELRPPVLEKEGLVGALQVRLEAVEGRADLETELKVEGKSRLLLQIEEELYRIAQEALNNILKHAQAGRVTVYLRQTQPTTVLEIVDDGVGFDPATAGEQGGLGLRGMQERAARVGGSLSIDSAPGAGTRVKVTVPVSGNSHRRRRNE